ncbi:hypothetical protein HDV64DRAFT_261770 [Trichoderma sp. TUCIM 5745]
MIALGLAFLLPNFVLDRKDRIEQWGLWEGIVTCGLNSLVLVGMFFLSLSVAAYVQWVGFIAAALSGFFAVAVWVPVFFWQGEWASHTVRNIF